MNMEKNETKICVPYQDVIDSVQMAAPHFIAQKPSLCNEYLYKYKSLVSNERKFNILLKNMPQHRI